MASGHPDPDTTPREEAAAPPRAPEPRPWWARLELGLTGLVRIVTASCCSASSS
jgi:hypothetical protein